MIILNLSQKECMSHLLLEQTFDHFSLIKAEIKTFNTFEIDGFINQEFFDAPVDDDFSKWSDIRKFCLSIIRGKRTPLDFMIVFSLRKCEIPQFLAANQLAGFSPTDIKGLYLNLKYDGRSLSCTTGTSMSLFTLDKSLEQAWDQTVIDFFKANAISYEIPV